MQKTQAQLNAQERGFYYSLEVAELDGLRGRVGWGELGRDVPRKTEPASMYHPRRGYKVQLFSEDQTVKIGSSSKPENTDIAERQTYQCDTNTLTKVRQAYVAAGMPIPAAYKL
jgi:hypothetical protein